MNPILVLLVTEIVFIFSFRNKFFWNEIITERADWFFLCFGHVAEYRVLVIGFRIILVSVRQIYLRLAITWSKKKWADATATTHFDFF